MLREGGPPSDRRGILWGGWPSSDFQAGAARPLIQAHFVAGARHGFEGLTKRSYC